MSILNGLTPPERKRNCKVATIMTQLESADAKILLYAIQDSDRWPARTLSNALQSRGIVLSDLTISRHRISSCSCNA